MISRIKDPVSGFTHLFGVALSILGLVLLVYRASAYGSVWHIVSFSIFGASLILLYTASTIYHILLISGKATRVLRKIDHMMIYVLIAGTYTPICLVPLRGPWGWSLLVGIWVAAAVGIVMKGIWLNAPRWLYTISYVVMGGAIIIAILPLSHRVPVGGIAWLAAGGITYLIGAAVYATKWPNISKFFGFHEVFHLFVLGGSLCHFLLMYRYVMHL